MSREMRDSGIEWIGQIPKHWSKDKIIRAFRMIGSGTTPKSTDENNFDGDINWIQSGDINGGIMTSCKNRVSNETVANCSTLKVYSAPFIIVAMYGASVGNTSISTIDGCVNQACCVLGNSALNFSYVFSVIKSCKDYWLRKAVGGGQPNISQETIKQTWIPIPPVAEQQAIADFLDRKCAEVDEMIALQEQIIEELKAYKQSVITEAVTKGLNPNAPMRDSGIEWIEQIPEHWEVSKLNYFVSKIGSGSTPTGGSDVYANSGVKFIRSQNVYFDGFKLDEIVYITDEIDESMKGTRVFDGDVLLNITGGSIGRCYYVDSSLGRANVNQHVSIIRPKSKTNTKYLKYFLQSEVGQIQIKMLQTGGNREGLSAAALKEFRFLSLPLAEQQAIADYLDEKCADIDSLIQTKQQKIDSLKEYKKSIIYEYVTGKREVEL